MVARKVLETIQATTPEDTNQVTLCRSRMNLANEALIGLGCFHNQNIRNVKFNASLLSL